MLSFLLPKIWEGEMSYRQIYKEVYGDIPNNWEVHHIDYNHSNNEPSNLVALPKSLHQKLHKAYKEFLAYSNICDVPHLVCFSGHADAHSTMIISLANYINVLHECVPYMNSRMGV